MAFMNPGGVRADLTFDPLAGRRGAGRGDLRRGLHGPAVRQPARLDDAHGRPDRHAARAAVVNRPRPRGVPAPRHLERRRLHLVALRAASRAEESTPTSITLNGTPIDPAASYRVTVNSFLADGGDGFTVLPRRHRPRRRRRTTWTRSSPTSARTRRYHRARANRLAPRQLVRGRRHSTNEKGPLRRAFLVGRIGFWRFQGDRGTLVPVTARAGPERSNEGRGASTCGHACWRCCLQRSPVLGGGASAFASANGVVISEFRFRGTAGGNDEFVELINAGTSPVRSSGWLLQGCAAASGIASTRVAVPAGIVLSPGQHYLFVNNNATGGYSSGRHDVWDRLHQQRRRTHHPDTTTVVDGVGGNGIGGTQCREGSGIVGMPTANGDQAYERIGGTQDTDDNVADFVGPKASNPQKFGPTGGDAAPSVASKTPTNGAVDVANDANVSITFSEDVAVSGAWYSISCTTSGAHAATVSGGPRTYVLDPTTDYSTNETCTVTVDGLGRRRRRRGRPAEQHGGRPFVLLLDLGHPCDDHADPGSRPRLFARRAACLRRVRDRYGDPTHKLLHAGRNRRWEPLHVRRHPRVRGQQLEPDGRRGRAGERHGHRVRQRRQPHRHRVDPAGRDTRRAGHADRDDGPRPGRPDAAERRDRGRRER